MRTVTQTYPVYTYRELPEAAKQKALQDYCDSGFYDGTDFMDTLKAFGSIFPVEIRDYSWDEWNGYVSFSSRMRLEIEELSGIRLLTYIYNTYGHHLFKGKYLGKQKYSKVFFERDYNLTGYYADWHILEPIYHFLKNPDNNINFYNLMKECFDSWVSAACADVRDYYSEEMFIEACEANEWEFLESGEMV